eukprot:scaffold2430_cov159-Amphora_coffeaeformis.AAC.8
MSMCSFSTGKNCERRLAHNATARTSSLVLSRTGKNTHTKYSSKTYSVVVRELVQIIGQDIRHMGHEALSKLHIVGGAELSNHLTTMTLDPYLAVSV